MRISYMGSSLVTFVVTAGIILVTHSSLPFVPRLLFPVIGIFHGVRRPESPVRVIARIIEEQLETAVPDRPARGGEKEPFRGLGGVFRRLPLFGIELEDVVPVAVLRRLKLFQHIFVTEHLEVSLHGLPAYDVSPSNSFRRISIKMAECDTMRYLVSSYSISIAESRRNNA